MRAIKCYCDDCGLDYEDLGWIEAIVPDEVWWTITPAPPDNKRGGILCITCIARRCKEAGFEDVPVRLCGMEVLRAVTTERALFANDKHGPNFMAVVRYKVAHDAVPEGGGLAAAIELFTEPGRLKNLMCDAIGWVEEAIAVMRTSPDNPWGDDEETLAGAILERLEER